MEASTGYGDNLGLGDMCSQSDRWVLVDDGLDGEVSFNQHCFVVVLLAMY